MGYSFPVSIIMNSAACLAREFYVPNVAAIGSAYLLAAAVLFVIFRRSIQDEKVWTEFLASAKEA